MQNRKFDFLSRIDELPSKLYILLGVVSLAFHVVLSVYTKIPPVASGLVILCLYALLSGVIFLLSRRKLYLFRTASDASDAQNAGVISAFRDWVNLPYAVLDETGKILTVNAALRALSPERELFWGRNITEICELPFTEILRDMVLATDEDDSSAEEESASARRTATMGDKTFEVACSPIRSRGHIYYMMVFHDVTDLTKLRALHEAKTPVVAYILLDSPEEIAKYAKDSYRSEADKVDSLLTRFANQMDGVLREYDRNKYLLFFTKEKLDACVQAKFDILDQIRNIRVGDDSIPLTISMGVAVTGETLDQREHDALACLDMALQRGGDQVVLKNETGIYYFGGKTKGQQKRTSGQSRITANKLCSMISSASNVVIMGHSNPDFDSIGACVGLASLALHVGADVKIVTDTSHPNFRFCTEKLLELPEYRDIFVDGVDGLAVCSYSTLVIIVDANNFSILEAPEIAENSFRTAVIDHHIKKQEFENEPQLSYIDPSASSTCELITEILEQALPAGVLRKEEANILLSGIMVDTKNFTRTVGTRTFSAALYLRAAGGSTEVAGTFFHETFEDYRSEALFGAEVELYRDQIAITMSAGTDSPRDRVAAAKAADKLLTIRNINAAFALVHTGNTVHISARSNGRINVQLILERIGGGGHFDVAGAAVAERTLEEARKLLVDAIDDYLEPDKKQQKPEES